MEILLTPEEIGLIAGLEPQYIDDYELSLCRAQVRKVVEWMKKHTTQRLYVNADFSNDEPIRVSMTGSDWQALRKAGGAS